MASARDVAGREYTEGESTSLLNLVGGWRVEEVSMTAFFWGGDAGGVSSPVGCGPGEHSGMCLFGMAAGVPREDVLRVRCGGGVAVRVGIAGGLTMAVAILQRCGLVAGEMVEGYGVERRRRL